MAGGSDAALQTTGLRAVTKEDVISKLKDDGDFDDLRLKVVRRLKENEELRNNIISIVKQSTAVNRADLHNIRPRQLSDAIFDEVGSNVMSLVSDGLWEIIRSKNGGMRDEIRERVQAVHNKLLNGERDEGADAQIVAPAKMEEPKVERVNASAMEGCEVEPDGPPGFVFPSNDVVSMATEERVKRHLRGEECGAGVSKENKSDVRNGWVSTGSEFGVPPGFAADEKHVKCDEEDEDPDVPPGFG